MPKLIGRLEAHIEESLANQTAATEDNPPPGLFRSDV
jgi:hypothetical protein